MTASVPVPVKSVRKSISFTEEQRVLFRYAARPTLWVSGRIVAGPKAKQGRMFYRVKLDNGECRWGPAHQLRSAQLQ